MAVNILQATLVILFIILVVYFFSLKRKINERHSDSSATVGLGGWLIIVGLGVVITPLYTLIHFIESNKVFLEDGVWELLTIEGSEYYVEGIKGLLIFETLLNIGLISAHTWLIYLFFSKNYRFPVVFIILWTLPFVYLPAYAWYAAEVLQLEDVFDSDTVSAILKSVIYALIWIPYMVLSERVRQTFVNGKASTPVSIKQIESETHVDTNIMNEIQNPLPESDVLIEPSRELNITKPEFNHQTLSRGYQIEDYVIEDLLGQGGFGIAYLARDLYLQNHVVIKEYFPNDIVSRDGQTVAPFGTTGLDEFERGMQRFVEEGRALARFNHPSVARILKYIQKNNTAYLVMEFIDGESLEHYLKRKHTIEPSVVEHLAKELLDGLEVVHQHGLIHRDIKPANIMLRPGGKPVLIDFGAAKDALVDKSHSIVITPGYGALEQYSSKSPLSASTDLYALGGTLYKCLTGKTPEEATARAMDDEHTPISKCPIADYCSSGLTELIDKCLQIKQAERPQNAKEAKDMLINSIYQNL
ncbi:protein kinase domain-containing protein [Thiomicrospira microaerophila]|uniref:protein kinase domain-containing protein n=1 Tax=Thiomicrospira microaerophila TaxID=406020 RepID=UPI000697A550|nr:DUF2569 family protein [Thiomicrospira microaerophila]